jgi:hypothetical protein
MVIITATIAGCRAAVFCVHQHLIRVTGAAHFKLPFKAKN